MRAHEFITEHRLVFKRKPKGGISMKWRCETGPRKGRTVPDVAQCSAPPDIKKSAKMKQTRKRTKVAQARKTKKTKRVNPMSRTAAMLNKKMRKGFKESFTPNDFKENKFDSMADYRRWMRSPKDDKRGMTRYSVDKYESVISDSITESLNFNTKKTEARAFSNTFKMLDNRDHVSIEVGKQISVLSTVVVPGEKDSRIEVSGFVQPKEITKINLDLSDKIDSIEFSDGSMFPEAAEFTSVSGTNITNTAFFPDHSSASKAHTALWMLLSRMEGLGWTVERY
jgi:hypothetical protein